MTIPQDLEDIRHHLYTRAEQYWITSLCVSTLTLVFSIAVLWFDASGWIIFAGVLSLATPVVVAWARDQASTSLLRADKCRRLILYADGLGHEISHEDLAQVRAWVMGLTLTEAPFTRPYYQSEKAPGSRRLADIVAESAFFTEHLARKLEFMLWVAFGAALVAACAILYLFDLQSDAPAQLLGTVAKSIATVIAFLISGDLLLLAKKFGELREEAHHVFQRCAHLRKEQSLSADEVRVVVDDYGIALLQAPPIPSWLYLAYRDPLNNIWRFRV